MLIRTNCGSHITDDGGVRLQWHVTDEGRVFLDDLLLQRKILCSYLVKSYLGLQDQVRAASVCRSFRRAYSIKKQTLYIFRLKIGRDAFAYFSSFFSVVDYSRIAATHRYGQVIFGNARLIRSVHLVNPGLPKALVASNTNLVALHALVEANKDTIAPHLVKFVKAKLESIVKILLGSKKAFEVREKSLRVAAEQGDLSMILTLFDKTISGVDLKDAIFRAAKNGHAACVRLLLSKISEIEDPFPRGGLDKPLEVAAGFGHVHCIETLFEFRESLAPKNLFAPLRLSVINNKPKSLRALLRKRSSEIRALIPDVILIALEKGHLECFRILFENLQDEFKAETLYRSILRALQRSQVDFIRGLLPQYEAMVNRMFKEGFVDKSWVISFAKFKIVEFLKIILKFDIPSSTIKYALHVAVENGSLEIVKIFFELKPTVSRSAREELLEIALEMANDPINAKMVSYLSSVKWSTIKPTS